MNVSGCCIIHYCSEYASVNSLIYGLSTVIYRHENIKQRTTFNSKVFLFQEMLQRQKFLKSLEFKNLKIIFSSKSINFRLEVLR